MRNFQEHYFYRKWKCQVRVRNRKVRDVTGASYSTCKLKYSIPKKIPAVFHNGSNYDYCFIIIELAKSLKENLVV